MEPLARRFDHQVVIDHQGTAVVDRHVPFGDRLVADLVERLDSDLDPGERILSLLEGGQQLVA